MNATNVFIDPDLTLTCFNNFAGLVTFYPLRLNDIDWGSNTHINTAQYCKIRIRQADIVEEICAMYRKPLG